MKPLLEEWHCTLRGPTGTEFEGGLYHFRILLPAEYPFRPPSLMMLTPNGRFELNTKVSNKTSTWTIVGTGSSL
jgi:ubiquitin-conjugating enzyme E2 J1